MQIEINNITLNYTQSGKGEPVILLHGNGEDLHIFDQLVNKLNAHFTVYAIDSRNHGESSKTEDFSYETMAEDIFQFIQNLQLKDVSVIGFSDGAIIATLMSIAHKDIFKKMVLLGINLKPSDFKKEIYDSIVEGYDNTKDPLLKLMLEHPNIELSELKSISTPTLIVAAEDDLYHESLFTDIVETMPNASLEIMKGHDHGSYVVNNDILYPYLEKFL